MYDNITYFDPGRADWLLVTNLKLQFVGVRYWWSGQRSLQ